MIVRIKYNGELAGGVRPRFTRTGRMYYTKDQLAFRKAVREALEGVDTSVLTDDPMEAELHAFYPAPKRQKGLIELKWTRPDVDNLLKPVYDSVFKMQAKRKGSKRWDDGLVDAIDVDDSRVARGLITKYSTHIDSIHGFVLSIRNVPHPTLDDLADILQPFYGKGVLDDYR